MLNVRKISMIAKIGMFALTLMLVALPALAQDQFGVDIVGQSTGLSAGGEGGLRAMIGNIIQVALGFLGVVALIVVLIGGFQYMTAGGNEEKAKKARGWIISGVIGLAIIISAYAITTFVIGSLVEATGADNQAGE